MANIYGYIRVSTRDQNEDRQLIALRELKIPEKNIFMDADFRGSRSGGNALSPAGRPGLPCMALHSG